MEDPEPQALRPVEPERKSRLESRTKTNNNYYYYNRRSNSNSQWSNYPMNRWNPWTRAFWTFWRMNEGANRGFDVQCTVPRACHVLASSDDSSVKRPWNGYRPNRRWMGLNEE